MGVIVLQVRFVQPGVIVLQVHLPADLPATNLGTRDTGGSVVAFSVVYYCSVVYYSVM